MSLLRTRIDPLLEQIEEQRSVVDGNLTRPARWRGHLRREVLHGAASEERRAYAAAFDDLSDAVAAGDRSPVTAERVRRLHRALGGDGEFRADGARVGRFVVSQPVGAIPGLVEEAVERAADGVEPPVLAAARLHMELLLVHPFRDGNGRAARLAASAALMAAGLRSTLLTAVEEHSRVDPGRYPKSWALLRVSRPTQHEPWLYTALWLMAESSRHASAFRVREREMRDVLTAAGVPDRLHDRVLLDHDLARPRPHRAAAVLAGVPRWVELQAGRSPRERAAALRQIRRLLDEEASDPAVGG